MSVTVRALTGSDFDEAISVLADLRIRIFRDWPYLYDGDHAYETRYLARFKDADRAFLAAAFDGDTIVGAATAAPLSGEAAEFREPLAAAGYDVNRIFYFAESLLLPDYRGHGVGHAFFDAREAHARSFGGDYKHAVFCGVVRDADHPARPAAYRPLDTFWRKRGFAKLDGVTAHYAWKDVGDTSESEKPMQFWMKSL